MFVLCSWDGCHGSSLAKTAEQLLKLLHHLLYVATVQCTTEASFDYLGLVAGKPVIQDWFLLGVSVLRARDAPDPMHFYNIPL